MTDEPLHPEVLSWSALLGRWLEFARASVALPKDAEGRAWRDSVAPIVNLQAVTFALADLDRVDRSEHPLAADKAEILIDGAQRDLEQAWGGRPVPPGAAEVLRDAAAALAAVKTRLQATHE